MAYFDHLIFVILWISPDVIIINVVLRANMKFPDVEILWEC